MALQERGGQLAAVQAELASATEEFSRASSASDERLSVTMGRVACLEVPTPPSCRPALSGTALICFRELSAGCRQ